MFIDTSKLTVEGDADSFVGDTNYYYYDEDTNIRIIIDVEKSPSWYDRNQEHLVHLKELNSQVESDEPRAEKGLTRKILCSLIYYIIKNNIQGVSDNTLFILEPVDISGVGNLDNLKFMYKSMSLNPRNKFGDSFDPWWETTVGNFLKWCEGKYNNFEEDWDYDLVSQGSKEDRKKIMKNEKALQYLRETGDYEGAIEQLER